jgi:nucleoporin NUP82
MPKIKSFAPSWLNEPSPGHKLFAQSSDDARFSTPSTNGKKAKPGPRRTIARRGTEVFVAAGKEIRWGDLAYLKESWETKQARSGSATRIKREGSEDSFDQDEEGLADGYRVSEAPKAQCSNGGFTLTDRKH